MQFIAQRAIIVLCFALPLAGCIGSTQQKLQELQRLAAETPKFPDFEQVNYSDISKSEETVVAYFYRSSATYDEVKSFYTNALLSRGWSSVQEEPLAKWSRSDHSRRLSFKKGKYTFHLEYDPDLGSKWKFAVDYGLSGGEPSSR
ncbi:MAG: hypothetical protein ACR2HX_03520 [Pyrinomonadaceae bacterium]